VPDGGPRLLTLYSRPGCHLCDELKAVVVRVGKTVPLSLEEIDIAGDPALEALYGLEIPVLMMDGRKLAKVRVTEEQLRRALQAR